MRYQYESNFSETRIPKRMSKKRLIFFVTMISLIIGGYCLLALTKPMPVVKPSNIKISTEATQAVVEWPEQGQASIGSLEQGPLSSTPSQVPVPIASVAKTITALAVLQKKPIKDSSLISFTDRDVEFYNYYLTRNGSNVKVSAGQQLSEYQALEALMLPSANNIADSLAEWAFGSVEAYTTYAQAMVKSWGAVNTTVKDASGFSSETKSTPNDLIIIGQKALKDPTLKAIVAEKQAALPNIGTVNNVNNLLGISNVIGIKTGNTEEAGGCLLLAATNQIDGQHEVTIISAVTGSSNLQTAMVDSLKLIEFNKRNFSSQLVGPENDIVGLFDTPWGEKISYRTKDPVYGYGWVGKSYMAEIKVKDLVKKLPANSLVGESTVLSSGFSSHSPVVITNSVKGPSTIWRLLHYF